MQDIVWNEEFYIICKKENLKDCAESAVYSRHFK